MLVDGTGIHPHKPLEGFTFTNITGTCSKGISLANITKANLKNINVTGFTGPLLSINNVTGKGLSGATVIDPPNIPESVSQIIKRISLNNYLLFVNFYYLYKISIKEPNITK